MTPTALVGQYRRGGDAHPMPRDVLSSVVRRLRRPRRPVSLPAATGRAWGRALVSYMAAPSAWNEDDPRLRGHSNKWESREIARSLSRLDLDVDVIDFDDVEFRPRGSYDVVLGIHSEVHRLGEQTGARILLMHHTGAYPRVQNAAELRRIEELYERRGIRCAPRRMVDEGEEYERSLAGARASSLLGNEWTLSTFPREFQEKITCLPVSGSVLGHVKQATELLPSEREFLWFFGSGAVHKGLDRALEAFARRPELVLHVVGNIADEQDFIQAYRQELFELRNVHWHGFLEPNSMEFRGLARRCFCVVAPTCSEGTSPATVTMLQLGLYPVITRQCGITLPAGAGRYLDTCAVDEIETAITELHEMPERELREQMGATQAMALQNHSRKSFRGQVSDYLRKVIPRS